MANELKDFLVQSQWKQDKPEDTPVVKKARNVNMFARLRRIATEVVNRKYGPKS